MKRIINVLLVSAMLIGLVSIAGCGGSESKDESTESETIESEAIVSEPAIVESEDINSDEENITPSSKSDEIKIISFSCDKEGQEIEIGSGELITFTVEIESNVELNSGDIQLIASDSLGRENSYKMTDTSYFTDDVADDGIYTCGLFNTIDEPLTTEYHVEINGIINSNIITLETHEKAATVSANELGITVDELAQIINGLEVKSHNFNDLDEVKKQVELGAGLGFQSSDSVKFTYSADAYDTYGVVIWSMDNYDNAKIAENVINGNSDVKDSWESLKSLALSSTDMIDTWTKTTLKDDSYHTLTALINNDEPSLMILVVYNGEIIYDATNT